MELGVHQRREPRLHPHAGGLLSDRRNARLPLRPGLDLWHNKTEPSWWEPLHRERIAAPQQDPLALQIRNLCGVVRGTAAPLVPAREGLNTLKVIAAVTQAAESGLAVSLA